MTTDLTILTDDELAGLLDEARAEYKRRAELSVVLEANPELSDAWQDHLGREPGEPWVQPLGAFDGYPLDWTVTHDGESWQSLVAGNVWEPGISAWRLLPSEGVAEWVQPSGAHDAYPEGAEVTHNGSLWTSTVDANVWEPGVYGWTPTT